VSVNFAFVPRGNGIRGEKGGEKTGDRWVSRCCSEVDTERPESHEHKKRLAKVSEFRPLRAKPGEGYAESRFCLSSSPMRPSFLRPVIETWPWTAGLMADGRGMSAVFAPPGARQRGPARRTARHVKDGVTAWWLEADCRRREAHGPSTRNSFRGPDGPWLKRCVVSAHGYRDIDLMWRAAQGAALVGRSRLRRLRRFFEHRTSAPCAPNFLARFGESNQSVRGRSKSTTVLLYGFVPQLRVPPAYGLGTVFSPLRSVDEATSFEEDGIRSTSGFACPYNRRGKLIWCRRCKPDVAMTRPQ